MKASGASTQHPAVPSPTIIGTANPHLAKKYDIDVAPERPHGWTIADEARARPHYIYYLDEARKAWNTGDDCGDIPEEIFAANLAGIRLPPLREDEIAEAQQNDIDNKRQRDGVGESLGYILSERLVIGLVIDCMGRRLHLCSPRTVPLGPLDGEIFLTGPCGHKMKVDPGTSQCLWYCEEHQTGGNIWGLLAMALGRVQSCRDASREHIRRDPLLWADLKCFASINGIELMELRPILDLKDFITLREFFRQLYAGRLIQWGGAGVGHKEMLYKYSPHTQIWDMVLPSEWDNEIMDVLGDCDIEVTIRGEDGPEKIEVKYQPDPGKILPKLTGTHGVLRDIHKIDHTEYQPPCWMPGKRLVGATDDIWPFKNGVVDLGRVEMGGPEPPIYPLGPEVFCTSTMPCDFVSRDEAPPAPVLDRYLRTSLSSRVPLADSAPIELREGVIAWPDHDTITVVQMLVGYYLLRRKDRHHVMYMVGKSHSGKNTLQDVLEMLFPADTVAELDAESFLNPFALSTFWSNRLAIIGEARLPRERSSSFVGRLAAISGIGKGTMLVNPKHRDHYRTKVPVKLAITSNELIPLQEDSMALKRRLFPIPFNWDFAEIGCVDPTLKDRLREEIMGICWWAIDGVAMYLSHNGDIPKSAAIEKLLNLYSDTMSPIRSWVDECCEIIPGTETLTTTLDAKASWEAWCRINGHQPGGMAHLKRVLTSAYMGEIEYVRLRINGKNRHVFRGLKVHSWPTDDGRDWGE